MLYNVVCCLFTEHVHFSFLPCLMCASYEYELYMCFIYIMPSLQRCLTCIFVINVVTNTSMQTRLRDVADFSPCFVVIFMPYKLDATERSKHILRYFSKVVLNIGLFSIH